MKLYHYSKLDDWNYIQDGSDMSDDQPGLGANHRLGLSDEVKDILAVWAFVDPEPNEWKSNEQFPKAWKTLKANIGKMLLEIEIDDKNDKIGDSAYVVDWGHMEGYLRPTTEGETPISHYSHKTRRDAELAYLGSKIPLKEFLAKGTDVGYSLPEVIVTEHIPLEKIKISEKQPLLQEYMDDRPLAMLREWKTGIARRIQEIPELKKWWEEYLAEREQREGRDGLHR